MARRQGRLWGEGEGSLKRGLERGEGVVGVSRRKGCWRGTWGVVLGFGARGRGVGRTSDVRKWGGSCVEEEVLRR